MGAPKGNRNAVKQKKRVDVHASLADKRRARVEMWLQSQGFENITDKMIAEQAREWLYAWIDGLT
jgi:hypothetical protein